MIRLCDILENAELEQKNRSVATKSLGVGKGLTKKRHRRIWGTRVLSYAITVAVVRKGTHLPKFPEAPRKG